MGSNAVETALSKFEQLNGWPPESLWIAPDVSGNAAIWRMRALDDLLQCVGHVQGEEFAGLLAVAILADTADRTPSRRSDKLRMVERRY